jgi:hypothetical protein
LCTGSRKQEAGRNDVDLKRAEQMAADLSKLHNVDKNEWRGPGVATGKPWTFKWDDGTMPLSLCAITMFDVADIVMNERVIAVNDEAAFREIFVHELAHTKVDPFLNEDHGPVWQRMAYSMGCTVSVPGGGMPPGSLRQPEALTIADLLESMLLSIG